MDTSNKKRNDILIIGILFLVIILISSAYAFFNYSRTIQAFTLSSNNITATFTPGSSNEIDFTNAYPMSDEYAISHLSGLDYVDFTVSSNAANPDESVGYEIYLTEKVGNTLSNNYVKVYLTDNNDNEIAEPKIYGELPYTTYQEDVSTGRVVFVDNNLGQFTKNYRLYVWLDESFEENASKSFSFYVNFIIKRIECWYSIIGIIIMLISIFKGGKNELYI